MLIAYRSGWPLPACCSEIDFTDNQKAFSGLVAYVMEHVEVDPPNDDLKANPNV